MVVGSGVELGVVSVLKIQVLQRWASSSTACTVQGPDGVKDHRGMMAKGQLASCHSLDTGQCPAHPPFPSSSPTKCQARDEKSLTL